MEYQQFWRVIVGSQFIMNSRSFQDDDLQEQNQLAYTSETTIPKQLILESSHHSSTHYPVTIPYKAQTRQLDLGRVLHDILVEMIPCSHTYQVFYYNRNQGYFTFAGMFPFQELVFVPEEDIPDEFVFIRIQRIHPPDHLPDSEPNKKKRVNDRTIKQVLERVAEWRKIHETQAITLEEAAKMCQLPKKTLDDYFYQIRQAQVYNFDFEKNLDQKVGVLRKFVKENHTKKENSGVKVLEQFMREDDEEEEQ